jgi:outer membrane protein TolC
VAKSTFYPRFDAILATGANNNTGGEKGHNNNDWQAGVEMNYNLFRGGSDKARLQSDAHKINQAMDIRNNALRELNENLSLAWNAMNNASKQLPTAREYAETTKRVRAPTRTSSAWASAPCSTCSTAKTSCTTQPPLHRGALYRGVLALPRAGDHG